MPEERSRVIAPEKRLGSFKEVVLGINSREAVENSRIYLERERALKGEPCPLGTDHLGVVRLVSRNAMVAALDLLLSTNCLPDVTGRLCPEVFEETLCQNQRGNRISLRALERFLGEHYKSAGIRETSGKSLGKVAVVGSGPAGLSAAWALTRRGYAVTVFEAATSIGGVLAYAWADFELPASVVSRVAARFEAAGVHFVTNFLFGRVATALELLEQGFGAVLVATGAGRTSWLGIEGENAGGSISASEFLKAVHARHEDIHLWLGPKVIVVGENDAAFSCARMAVRARRQVTVVVRGPETHIKANPMFVRHAIEEGVRIKAFTRPVKMSVGLSGCVSGLVCRYLDYRMDGKGRLVMTEDETAEFTLEADTVVLSVGWEPDTLFLRDMPGLEFNDNGTLRTKPEMAETGVNGVFAAGGVVEPEMSLTDVMLSGSRAADEIDRYLNLK
ncbi:MAG: FAD-dependent oxidoreductase [Candidatus Omnitrophota bacterium]